MTSPSELRTLRGWGRATSSRALVTRPESASAVHDIVRAPGDRGVLARGLGRAYGDAAQNAGGRVIDMTALHAIRDFDPSTGRLTADSGLSIAALAGHTLPRGWFPAVVPGTRWVTIGGALAADVHGKNHHVDGGFADHVLAFELVTPDGQRGDVTREGDPVAWAATVGGMGLSGVITAATLQLIPVPSVMVREELTRAADLDELLARLTREDRAHRYSVAWVDCATPRGRGILMHGDHADAGADTSVAPLIPPRVRAPRRTPGALLGRPAVRAFNAVWFHLEPRIRRSHLVPLASFFWPLDGVRGWNRLYGPRGLVQHQSVVPHGAEEVLHAILERARRAGIAPVLGVLKRLGGGSAPLSFPMEGWTLALDLPGGARGLDRLLDGFDDLVAGAGGRVYLAKDARLRPAALGTMYPQLDRWRAARDKLDALGAMRSDLGRRLELT